MRIAILVSGLSVSLAGAVLAAAPADARSNATMSRQNNPGFSASMGYGQRQELPPAGAPAIATRGGLRVRVACEGLPMTVCRRHGLRLGAPLLPRTSKDTASLAPRLNR